jgi:hypothetical protein
MERREMRELTAEEMEALNEALKLERAGNFAFRTMLALARKTAQGVEADMETILWAKQYYPLSYKVIASLAAPTLWSES